MCKQAKSPKRKGKHVVEHCQTGNAFSLKTHFIFRLQVLPMTDIKTLVGEAF